MQTEHSDGRSPGRLRLGVAIVTLGTRQAEVDALLRSVTTQTDPADHVVIVGNGTKGTDVLPDYAGYGLPGRTTVLETTENLGCPGGRNAALTALRAAGGVDVVVELDDDGLLIDDTVFARVREHFETSPALGILAFRIADETGHTQRRHIPRLRASGQDALRAGDVTAFLGGAHAFSMPMLEAVGDWPAHFFFTHEETDLAWRAINGGWRVHYDPRLVLRHPRTSPARHPVYYRMTARNRVWLARRNLPAALVPVYLGVWTLLTLLRTRSATGLRAWAGGFAEGLRTPAGRRHPMTWHTVWQLTRLGRPPVI